MFKISVTQILSKLDNEISPAAGSVSVLTAERGKDLLS